MKKVLSILSLIVSSIVIILGLVFVFIEGRLIISLDWMVYENPFGGFIKYLFRLLLAIISIGLGILDYINYKRKNKVLSFTLICGLFGMLIMSLMMLFTTKNYVNFACLGLSIILLLINFSKLRMDGLI